MDRATDERWRAALEKKGLHVVRQQLDLHTGRPADLLYDVVDEPPYPTRAYCEQWCRGAPPKKGGMSGSGAMVLIMSLLVVVCVIRALSSYSSDDANWLSPDGGTFHQLPPAAPPQGGGSLSDDMIPNAAAQNNAVQNSSVISTQDSGSILPGCTSVTTADNTASVQPLPSCSKLGQPFIKQSNGPHG